MSERRRNMIVGLTALVGLAGVCALMMLFGQAPLWLEKGYRVRVEMPNSGGVTAGSRVTYSGMDIGRVTGIELVPPPGRGVAATVLIRDEVSLPRDTRAVVESSIFGGTPTLEFDSRHVPDSELGNLVPRDGSARITGHAGTLVSEFAAELRSAMDESLVQIKSELDEPKQRLFRLEESLTKLSEQWMAVGRNVEALTRGTAPEVVDDENAPPTLSTVIARLDRRLKDLKVTMASVNAIVADPGLREDVHAAASGAHELTVRLNKTTDKLDETLDTSRKRIDELGKRYVALADDLSQTMRSLQKLIDQAQKGDGTVGKLLNDPAVFDNANDSLQRLSAALDELKLLAEEWKEEGLPIRLFD